MIPVKAGIDAILKQDGRTIGWARDVSFDEDFRLQNIETLGHHGPRGFKSMGYDANMQIGTLILNPLDEEGNLLSDNLITATRRDILTKEPSTFELIDLSSGQVFAKLKGCMPSNNQFSVSSTDLATKNTQWKVKEIEPVNMK